MITYRQGSLFDSNCQTLVCTVNCEGVMGKGIALEFKKKFPAMFSAYHVVCLHSATQLKHGGDLWLYRYQIHELFTLWTLIENDDRLTTNCQSNVLCFATKEYWRNPSRLDWIERGLQEFVTKYKEWNITSIAFPKLGCNNGGLDWMNVKPLMEKYLDKLDIPVEIYV